MSKVHAFNEVAEHNKKDDCWLIIFGKGNNYAPAYNTLPIGHMAISEVYNVTSFLDDHPGGDDVLLTATGKDATDDFEDVGHSDDAREMMKKYYVGEIDSSTLPVERKYTPPAMPAPAGNQGSGNLSKILQFLLPLLILGVALALRSFYQKE